MKSKFYHLFFGKKRFQKLFERIYMFCMSGMYYGHGGDFETSGELWVLDFIKLKLKNIEKLIVFDIGANHGKYSLELYKTFKEKNLKIHAYEPSPNTIKYFLENTKGISEITINNFGLSDQASNSLLYQVGNIDGLASVYNRKLDYFHNNEKVTHTESIELRTIDAYCKDNGLENIHFMKLDIEGHELNALKGGIEMIQNDKIDFIQFEFGESSIDSRVFIRDFFHLLSEKYRIYRVVKDGLYELETYKQSYEIFYTVNYLAIRKNAGYE